MRAFLPILLVCASGLARAQEAEPPPVAWSVSMGLVTAMVPMAVGGGITASYDDEGMRRSGIYAMTVGWAVAPFVSHAISHEWKRAAIFSAVPVAAAIVAIGLLEGSRPSDLLGSGDPPPRVAFGTALAIEAVACGVGLVDSMMAGERWKKHHKVMVAPQLGAGRFGLALGGSL